MQRRRGGAGQRETAAGFSAQEVGKRLGSLRARQGAPQMRSIMAKRRALPAAEFEAQVVAATEAHQVRPACLLCTCDLTCLLSGVILNQEHDVLLIGVRTISSLSLALANLVKCSNRS
jgi:hypothetical protein